jgi:uncharacterized protein YigE (DUF2233 family)
LAWFIIVAVAACLACVAASTLAINLSPRVLLLLVGLEPMGSLQTALPPQAPPLVLTGEPLDRIEVLVPPHVEQPLSLSPTELGRPMVGDASSPGITTYLIAVDEESLNGFLMERFFAQALESVRYRDVEIDLKPQGLVLYADVQLGLRWQRMGLLLLQEENAPALSTAGVVLNQQLYAVPKENSLARVLLPAGRQAQRALYGLTIVGPLPGEARVELARLDHEQLQIVARATYDVPPQPDTGWQPLEPGVELREIDVAAHPDGPTERLQIVRLDPGQVLFRVGYDPINPKRVSDWGRDLQPLLVVNGAYFAPENEGNQTIGLVVANGQRWGRLLGAHAGMFAVTARGDVSVRWLQQRPYDPAEPLSYAMQSFPVLVRPGGMMGFPADADEGTPARRTVVAQDRQGNVLLIVAPRGHLSLHQVAVSLAGADLGVDIALNLDGGGSTGMWLAAGEAAARPVANTDSYTPVPSVILVERR